jgi:hypothetical protein
MSHQDGGFGHALTRTHVPLMGMIHPLPLPPRLLVCVDPILGTKLLRVPSNDHKSRFQIGKLPKINFPRFEGDNPKLWQSHCESYFDMYGVDSGVWVQAVTMHFDGPAARWLQSVNHWIKSASWSDVCGWIHDRFGRDQHESLIRQLFHIKQIGSIQEYIDKFTELIDRLVSYEQSVGDQRYYTTRFVDGLKDEVKSAILVQRPIDLDTACTLALLPEEAVGSRHREFRKPEYPFK